VVAEHNPLASRYTLLSAQCLISVLCVTNVYNNNFCFIKGHTVKAYVCIGSVGLIGFGSPIQLQNVQIGSVFTGRIQRPFCYRAIRAYYI